MVSIISNVPSISCASVLLLFLPPTLDFTGAQGHSPAALEIGVEVDVVLSLNKFNQYYFWEFTIIFSCLGKGEFGRMKAWWVWEVCLFIRVQKIKRKVIQSLKSRMYLEFHWWANMHVSQKINFGSLFTIHKTWLFQ